MNAQGLASAGARGGAVTLIGQMAKIGLQLASMVVLARLLTPFDFGIIAMLMVFTSLGELLRDFGLGTASIQADHLKQQQKSNLFWINAFVGVLLFVVMTALAVPIAALYDQPLLIPVVPVVALIFVVNGLQTQFMVELSRRHSFGALTLTDVIGQVVGFGVAVVAALNGLGYWALALQMVVAFGTTFVGRMVLANWLPSLPRRSDGGISSILRFGGHLGLAQVLSYGANNAPSLLIGVAWGAGPLGIYNRAYQLVSMPNYQLLNPLTNVALPLLSRARAELDTFWRMLASVQASVGYVMVAMLAFLAGTSEAVIAIVLGPDWAQAAAVFRLLALGGCFQVLSTIGYWAFLAFGASRSLLHYNMVTKSVAIALPAVGLLFGLEGVAAGYSLALLLAWPVCMVWLGRAVQMPVSVFMKQGARIIAAGAIIFGATRALSLTDVGSFPVVNVCLALAVTVISLSACCALPAYRRDARALISMFKLLRKGT